MVGLAQLLGAVDKGLHRRHLPVSSLNGNADAPARVSQKGLVEALKRKKTGIQLGNVFQGNGNAQMLHGGTSTVCQKEQPQGRLACGLIIACRISAVMLFVCKKERCTSGDKKRQETSCCRSTAALFPCPKPKKDDFSLFENCEVVLSRKNNTYFLDDFVSLEETAPLRRNPGNFIAASWLAELAHSFTMPDRSELEFIRKCRSALMTDFDSKTLDSIENDYCSVSGLSSAETKEDLLSDYFSNSLNIRRSLLNQLKMRGNA